MNALARRGFLTLALILALPLGAAAQSHAVSPAESFVSANIRAGMAILVNAQLTPAQRKAQFQAFLLGVVDMKRIAAFTLGRYGADASPADKEAFAAAFQDYAVAVYQSYFARYSGQSLTILRSDQRSPTDFVIATQMADPKDRSGQPPLEIDFRVRTDGPKPVIVDFSVAGIWLAIAEQADFGAVLARNGGSLPALTAHLRSATAQY